MKKLKNFFKKQSSKDGRSGPASYGPPPVLTGDDRSGLNLATYYRVMARFRGRLAKLLSVLLLLVLIPSPAQAKTVFYLDLKKGCYAGNSPVKTYLEWSLPGYKKLYTASCYSKYHYQVYLITKLTTRLSDNEASQSQANDKCEDAALRIIGNKSISDYLSIGWFFPDAGAEEAKYGKKLICFFRMLDPEDSNFTVAQTKPMP